MKCSRPAGHRLMFLLFAVSWNLCGGVFELMADELTPEGRLAVRFRELDRNADGEVTPVELRDSALFQRFDTNEDQRITLKEALAVLQRQSADGQSAGSSESQPMTPVPPERQAALRTNEAEAGADDPVIRESPQVLRGSDRQVGRAVDDVAFTDIRGDATTLSRLAGGMPVVVAVYSTSCPLSQKYRPTLIRLARRWHERGVRFLLFNPTATDGPEGLAELQQDLGNSAVCVFDKDQSLASSFSVSTTTEVLIVDRHRTVLYQGAVDDQYGFGYAREHARSHYLEDALADVLAGRRPLIEATSAPGCHLVGVTPAKSPAGTGTWHREIKRLVQRNCGDCHYSGGVAPFSLISYEEMTSHAPMVREVLRRRTMPPWFASGKSGHRWLNDRSLTADERAAVTSWIDAGMPEGNRKDAPAPLNHAEGWKIGPPDAVFTFSEPVPVQAEGKMPYKYVTVDTELTADHWVNSIEIRPGAPEVVHHVIVSVIDPGRPGERIREADGFWGVYVPGNSTLEYPAGYARKLPAGARLRFQMHYTPNGRETRDLTRVGVRFCDPPSYEVKVAGIANGKIRIPPFAAHHKETATLRIPGEVSLLSFLPHMHLRGKAARYDLFSASGESSILLDVPHYDFNWQLVYRLAEPITAVPGDRIQFTAWFDNSLDNPANPDAAAEVRWGQQTDDEMHLGYVEYVELNARQQPAPSSDAGGADHGGEGIADDRFRRLDLDGNGSLELSEARAALPGREQLAVRLFRRLDSNSDGRLSPVELRKLRREDLQQD